LFNLTFLTMLWATSKEDLICQLFTVFVTYLPTCSVLWTMCISYTAYKKVIVNIGELWKISRNLHRFYHLIAWGYPFVACVILVLIPNHYDQEAIGCWIPRRPWTNQVLRFCTVYSVLWIAWGFNGIIYYKMIKHGREIFQKSDPLLRQRLLAADEQLTRLAWIPIAFVIIRFWGSLNAIKDVFSPDTSWFLVNLLQAIGDQAQGFIHGMIFVFTNQHFKRRFKRWITCVSEHKSQEDGSRLIEVTSSGFGSLFHSSDGGSESNVNNNDNQNVDKMLHTPV